MFNATHRENNDEHVQEQVYEHVHEYPREHLDDEQNMRLKQWRYLLVGLAMISVVVYAQSPWENDYQVETNPNPSYDGRYTFARLRYSGNGCMTDEGPGWHHDYPVADRHLMKIISELTSIDVRPDTTMVFNLDDPMLMKYPIAYMAEPGCWRPSESEVQGFRSYLHKGGFVIFDDFRGSAWSNLERQMRRVLPNGRFIPIEASDPVFQVFFGSEMLNTFQNNFNSAFLGIYEDNDPTKRLIVVANYNNDIGDYWQWSAEGFLPVQSTNEAYKLGVNYMMYGFTH